LRQVPRVITTNIKREDKEMIDIIIKWVKTGDEDNDIKTKNF